MDINLDFRELFSVKKRKMVMNKGWIDGWMELKVQQNGFKLVRCEVGDLKFDKDNETGKGLRVDVQLKR